MTDGQTLFAVLCAIYLFDCFLWLRKQSVALVSTWWQGWRPVVAGPPLGGSGGSILLTSPLPPFGRVVLGHLSPLSISPAGVCAHNLQSLTTAGRPPQSGQALSFEQIRRVSADGVWLEVNRARFARCGSPVQAHAIARLVKATASASPENREALIREVIATRYDRQGAQETLANARSTTRLLRWACTLLFVFLFVVVPLLTWLFHLSFVFVPSAAGMFLLAIQVNLLFRSAHRRLHPGLGSERVVEMVKMTLCAPAAVRASDILMTEALASFSPFTVAAVLAPEETSEFRHYFVRDLQHPVRSDLADSLAIEIARWHAAAELSACLESVRRDHDPIGEDVGTPPVAEAGCVSYCPRCHGIFTVASGKCPDCLGVPLMAFQKLPAASDQRRRPSR